MPALPIGLTGTVRNAAGATSAPASAIINPFCITPGVEFATNAWCYQRLAANAPIDTNSAAIVNTLLTAVSGSALYNSMGMPTWVIPAGTPTQAVRVVSDITNFQDAPGDWPAFLRSQLTAVPIPPNFFVSPGSDLESIIYQPSTGKLWEFWQMAKDPQGRWCCVWGGYEGSMTTSDGTWAPQGPLGVKEGMVAAGIHWLSFQVTLGDLKAQAINHPVGIVVPTGSARSDVWNHPPAWRCDGTPPQLSPTAIPEGGIFRLPANLNLNNYPATTWDGVSVKTHWRIVAEAMQNYGMVAFDQGGGWLLAGEDQVVYGAGDIISSDPILSQVMGAPHPWGYTNQYTDPTQFPFSQLQLLQTNLVNTP